MTEWSEASSEVILTARDLIEKHHPHLKDANIAFVFRDEAQKSGDKLVLGHASKVSDREKPLFEYDFLIWIAEREYSSMNRATREALIDHELCHCGGFPGAWKLRHHDVEEFTEIVQRHGFWTNALLSINQAEQTYQLSMLDEIERRLVGRGKIEAIKPAQLQGIEQSVEAQPADEPQQVEPEEAESAESDHDQAADELLDGFLGKFEKHEDDDEAE